jgi:hypothetical protein
MLLTGGVDKPLADAMDLRAKKIIATKAGDILGVL